MATEYVAIQGLKEFRAQLKAAIDATPRELTKAIRAAGKPAIVRAAALAAKRTGALAASYKVQATGTTGKILNTQPYGAGAEWGQFGKWKGFLKYGGPGRFAARAVEEKADEIAEIIEDELTEIVTIHGWAR